MLVYIPMAYFPARKHGEHLRKRMQGVGVLDALNTLFFLCGAIALAAALDIHSCSNYMYTTHNGITDSSPDTETRCREAQAATAFVWFNLIAFGTTLFITVWSLHFKASPEARRPVHPVAEDVAPGPTLFTGGPDVRTTSSPEFERRYGGRFGTLFGRRAAGPATDESNNTFAEPELAHVHGQVNGSGLGGESEREDGRHYNI